MSGEKGPQLDTPPPSAEAVKTAPEGQAAAPVEGAKAPEVQTEADQLRAKQEAEKAEVTAKQEAGKAEVAAGLAEKKSGLMDEVVGTAVDAAAKAGEPPVDAATQAKIEESLKKNTGKDGEVAEGFWADLAELGAGLAEIFKDLFDGIGKKKEDPKKDGEAEREAVESKDFGELLDPKARVFSFPKLVDNKEVNPRVTSRKGHRERPKEGASTDHKGDDIGVPTGTPIVYTGEEPATVKIIATQTDDRTGEIEGGGHYVSLLLPDGSEAFFMHLREKPTDIKEGDTVAAGELIGFTGNSGTSTGPHLHFEVRQNKVAVAPEPWLAERFQA